MKAVPLGFAAATRDDTRAAPARAGPGREAWPVSMLGVPFENVTLDGVLARIDAMIAARRPHRVATANLELLRHARRDPDQRRMLATADLVLCDSRALVAASWWLGNPLPERIRADDLTARLMQRSAAKGFRVFVVDDRPGGASECAQHLAAAAPGLRIAGIYSPELPAGFDGRELELRLRATPADLLFERVDAAAGGKWIAGHHRDLGVPVCLQCCLAADGLRVLPPVARSPSIAGSTAARLLSRLARAVALAPELLQQWACMSHGRRRRTRAAVLNASREWLDVDAGPALTRAACDANPALWRQAEAGGANCAIDVSRVRQIDATGLAVLTRCRLALHRAGRHCILVAPSEPMRLALGAAQLRSCFDVVASLRDAHQRVPARAHAERSVTRSLAWCGEIIAANSDDVGQMTAEYLRTFAANGATLVVIDLSRLRLVDVAGVSLMVRVKKSARHLPAEVLFVHPQLAVLQMLCAMRVDRLLLEGGQ